MKKIILFFSTILIITGHLVAQEQEKTNSADKNGGSSGSENNKKIIPNYNSGRDLRLSNYVKSNPAASRSGIKKVSRQKTIPVKEPGIETINELNQDSLSSSKIKSQYGSHLVGINSSSVKRSIFNKISSKNTIPGSQFATNLKNGSIKDSASSTIVNNVDFSNEVKFSDEPIEREDNISLKAGWISNSDKPIMIDSCNSLILIENQKNVYIGYLLQLKEEITGFYISFNNYSTVDFTLIEITSTGAKYPPVSFRLPSGNYKDHKIIFQPKSRYSNLLLKFIKEEPGSFILNNIKILEE